MFCGGSGVPSNLVKGYAPHETLGEGEIFVMEGGSPSHPKRHCEYM